MRLILLWSRPPGWSLEETSSWMDSEIRGLLGSEHLEGGELVRLEPASSDHSLWYEWLLVVSAADGKVDTLLHHDGALGAFIDELRGFHASPIVAREADRDEG